MDERAEQLTLTDAAVVLLRLPGAGKGTQAQLLAERGWSHINAGGLIRSEVAAETAWGINAAGLGVTVHAGEFGDSGNVWRALDQLGANRIGHGVSVVGCRQLARRLQQDQVLIEVSVTSNVALGAVPAPGSHPLPWLLEQGIPLSLNTDVPLHTGTELAAERQQAVRLIGGDWHVIDALEASARRHRFPDRPPQPGA
jgi:adenosine deaminase